MVTDHFHPSKESDSAIVAAMVQVLFPGSFDPVTLGHVDLIERGLARFDSLTVAVAENISKQAVFSLEERVALLKQSLPASPKLHICTFDGLVVDFCRREGHGLILRGLRSGLDFEYENQMAQTNRRLAPDVDTICLMTSPEFACVSSSLIKDIARNGGDVTAFVPEPVARVLNERLGKPA